MQNSTPGEIYAATRAELIAFGRAATEEESKTAVPATPAWSVRDVFAHVVGINTDFLEQNLDGIGSDAWTAVQVTRRADRSLDEICDEWESVAPQIDAIGAESPHTALRITGDLIVHVHDVGGAVDHEFDRRSEGVIATLGRYSSSFTERIAGAGLAEVRLNATDTEWSSVEPASGQVSLSGTAFELMRALSGRRSERQVRAMDWDGDHAAHQPLISAYGTPPADLIE